jgi:hypothetical protein
MSSWELKMPQSVWKLLEALEGIEKGFLTDKQCNGNSGNPKAGHSYEKKMVSFSECIPKN